MNEDKPLNYKTAGVDIEGANQLVDSIKATAKRTHRPGVLNSIGGFGALFEIPTDRFKQPILVSGTDGVGTKLKLAIELQKLDTIGIDLVAMCANDILTLGAEPLFFLDYYATGKLQQAEAKTIIAGIGKGCEYAGAALIGGETAEMPGMYHDKDFDLAGFCVGAVEKSQIIDGSRIKEGDILLALGSSGPHSNGYSLIRAIIERGKHSLSQAMGDSTLGEVLLEPTRIYVKSLLALQQALPIAGMVHITGGGLTENIPRILPPHLNAFIDTDSWNWPPIFQWLAEQGNIQTAEMYRTFNNGVGMILIVDPSHAENAIKQLKNSGENAWAIGHISKASDDVSSKVLFKK